jgi:hypothetical protein
MLQLTTFAVGEIFTPEVKLSEKPGKTWQKLLAIAYPTLVFSLSP